MEQPFIIGITGGSGSGKTVLLKAIAAAFSEKELCVISQDDYYYPREMQRTDENGVQNYDLPSCFNQEEFARDVELLLNGKIIQRQEYVYNNETSSPKTLTFHPAPIVIVEGIFIFHFDEVREMLDLKIFVDAREELKIIRRIKRDRVERNYPLDDVLYRYEHHVSPAYDQFIAPYKPQADIVINNHNNYKLGAEIVIGYLKNKLSSKSS